jgi:dCMP deaminase
MSISFLSSYRSKDPSTQVGACIVNSSNRIIGIGYNGFPAGCSDTELPWARTGATSLDTKYPYVCHAEVNAVLNTAASCQDARIYVALFPCNECAKIIIQSGIKEVVYLSDKYHSTEACVASRKMFGMAGVSTRQHVPSSRRVVIDFGGEGREEEEAGTNEGTKKKSKIEAIQEE